MFPEVVANPNLSYQQEEEMANNVVRTLAAQPEVTYQMAYNVIKAHARIFEEALSHLNHNAAMEKKADKLVYVLD